MAVLPNKLRLKKCLDRKIFVVAIHIAGSQPNFKMNIFCGAIEAGTLGPFNRDKTPQGV
jgi:hypothetical protein